MSIINSLSVGPPLVRTFLSLTVAGLLFCHLGSSMALAQDRTRRPSGPSEQARAKMLLDIASVQERAGDAAGAADTLKKARALESKIVDPSLKTDYLGVLADLLLRRGDKTEAGKVAALSAGLARESESIPDLCGRNWSNAASVFGRLGQEENYQLAVRSALAAYERSGGSDPDPLAVELLSLKISQLVEIQLEAGDDAGALETALRIPEDEDLRGEILLAVVESQLKKGKMEDAAGTFRKVPKSRAGLRLEGNLGFAGVAWRKGDAAAYARTLGECYREAARIEGGELYGEGLVDILNAQHEWKDLKGAQATIERILEHAESTTSPEAISDLALHQLERLEDRKGALATLERALKVASLEKDPEQKAWILTGIAVAFARAGDLNRAAKVSNTIPRSSHRADAFAQLADLRMGEEDESGAKQFLAKALEAASEIPDDEERSEQILRIVDGWAELGDFKEARRIVALIPVANVRAPALAELGAREKRFRLGKPAAGEMEEPWRVSEVPDILKTEAGKSKALESAANALELIGERESAARVRKLVAAMRNGATPGKP